MTSNILKEIEIISLKPKGYSLLFQPSVFGSNLDGHTWSTLIQAHCISEQIKIDDVIFDPESDLFNAISQRKESLEVITTVIELLSKNSIAPENTLAQVSSISDSDEDMNTKEFLEWMSDAGFDLTIPQAFEFGFDSFKDVEHSKIVQKALKEEGYSAEIEEIDDDVYFDINIKILPNEQELIKVESCFERIAARFHIDYLGFGVDMNDD